MFSLPLEENCIYYIWKGSPHRSVNPGRINKSDHLMTISSPFYNELNWNLCNWRFLLLSLNVSNLNIQSCSSVYQRIRLWLCSNNFGVKWMEGYNFFVYFFNASFKRIQQAVKKLNRIFLIHSLCILSWQTSLEVDRPNICFVDPKLIKKIV